MPRDTAWAMSEEDVQTFRRGCEAYNRRDVEALLEAVDPELVWQPLMPVLLGGNATVYRGHEGVREVVSELDSAFPDLRVDLSEVRDFGGRLLAIGRLRGRGRESGVETETTIVFLVELKNGRAARIREYLDPKEALEAAGLSE
jgi:ketosteroid isomerase-like protein